MHASFQHTQGTNTFVIETGKLAQQANGSVLLRYGDCVFLATATMGDPREGIDFFPLTIDIEERLYARGKIPGSFFRREGRPSTHGVLIARLTDRPIRPLFPKGFRQEIQIIITPLSIDQETPFETLAITAASAALSVSDIPFEGPIAATRMGYIDGQLVVNPTYEEIKESALDLIVASSRDGVIMMEAGAREATEKVVLDAIAKAHEVNGGLIEFQDDIVRQVGKPKNETWKYMSYPEELDDRLPTLLGDKLNEVFERSTGKADLDDQLDAIKSELVESLSEEYDTKAVGQAFEEQLEQAFKVAVLRHGKRPDGRGQKEIRSISSEVGLLPRTHGSALFTRGETQILGVATLGSVGDAQRMDNLTPEDRKHFMLHYNFPPYSVGEARRVGSPGRREIGHGALAERALAAVLPSEDDFPYTIRIVCEALSSNGSTSMASVCAGTLALMDAGVPIKTPVAGISVGLVTGDNGEYATITDIQGMEDHIGDMDFKVAGTADGITAIQLDIKVKSINLDMVRDALEQAKEGRLFILDKIRETISEAREELSPFAPRMVKISVPVEKIGVVIGPGGKTIRGIVEKTGATVDIQDDGTVLIGSPDGEAAQAAMKMVEDLTREIKVGDIYTGKVARIMDFGAFVEILPGRDGLVHISELADYHVPSVRDVVEIGEELTVVVKEIDHMGRVNLSRRALLGGGDGQQEGRQEGDSEREPAESRSENGGGYRRDEGKPQGGRPGGGRPGGGRGGPGGYRGGRPGGGGGRPQGPGGRGRP